MDARQHSFSTRVALLVLAALIAIGLWQGYGVLLTGADVR